MPINDELKVKASREILFSRFRDLLPLGWSVKRLRQNNEGIFIDEWRGSNSSNNYQEASRLLESIIYGSEMREEAIILSISEQESDNLTDIRYLENMLQQNMQDSSFSPIGAIAVCSSVYPIPHYFKSYGGGDKVQVYWIRMFEEMHCLATIDGDARVLLMGDRIMYDLEGRWAYLLQDTLMAGRHSPIAFENGYSC
ncbi:MAG: hypothetical protein R8K22_08575 [Mariprofundaceae bacterium]